MNDESIVLIIIFVAIVLVAGIVLSGGAASDSDMWTQVEGSTDLFYQIDRQHGVICYYREGYFGLSCAPLGG